MSDDNTNTPISEMKYKELQTLAKERNLNASGTKDELVARLTEAESATPTPSEPVAPTAPVEESNGAPAATEADKAPETPAVAPTVGLSAVQERGESKKADVALRQDAQKMKAHLDAQPKVSIMVPFEVGENAEQGKDIPFHCNLNGYAMDIPRGVYVDVPLQVADMIKARLESEGKIGSQWRIDANAAKSVALS